MIAVECYADEKLMLVLGVSKRKIRHESGKGRVLAKLKKEPSGTGLVDEDPDSAQPGEMCSYRKEQEGEGIYLFKHQSTPNKRLIMLCPRLEEWLYQRKWTPGPYTGFVVMTNVTDMKDFSKSCGAGTKP